MTIELARSFKTNAATYDIVKYSNGVEFELWIERTETDHDNELELVFEQHRLGTFTVKNEGGRIGYMQANQRGWDLSVLPLCKLHREVAPIGSTYAEAAEACARILLP